MKPQYTLAALLAVMFSLGTNLAFAQDVCEGLTGKARGICMSATKARCTDPTNESKACDKLAELYIDTVEEAPPWQPCPCFTLGTLNDHLMVLADTPHLNDYGCTDRAEDGTFGTWITTGSADYQVASTYQWGYWGTQCQHVDISSGYDIGIIVDNITFAEAMACRDIILASDMWAINLCPTAP